MSTLLTPPAKALERTCAKSPTCFRELLYIPRNEGSVISDGVGSCNDQSDKKMWLHTSEINANVNQFVHVQRPNDGRSGIKSESDVG